jgi:hypothetical protein
MRDWEERWRYAVEKMVEDVKRRFSPCMKQNAIDALRIYWKSLIRQTDDQLRKDDIVFAMREIIHKMNAQEWAKIVGRYGSLVEMSNFHADLAPDDDPAWLLRMQRREWTREIEHYKGYYKAVLKESDLEYFEEPDVSEPEEDRGEDGSEVEIESEDEEALQKVRATGSLAEVFGVHLTKDLSAGGVCLNNNAIREETEHVIKDPFITRDIGVTNTKPGLPIDDGMVHVEWDLPTFKVEDI